MQEKDELMRAKPMASSVSASEAPPQNPNREQLPDKPPPKVREEGEVTSSDDDALHTCTVAPSPSMSAPCSSGPNASVKTYMQGGNSGKSISANILAGSADIQSQTPGYCKGFSKNKVLFKSSNPGWRAPGANNNLVISFSDDDDSGSDGEERRQEKALAISRHPQVVHRSQKPPALPHVKLDTACRTAGNEGKVATKKVSLSRTFISSMTKINGSSVRSGGSSLAEQRSWVKKSNVAGRISASQDHGCGKTVDLSSSKLQDLRQQIAMRENELKLKIGQKNKENVLDSCRDVKVSSRKCRPAPADVQTDPEEPDRKRLKIAHKSADQPSSGGHNEKSLAGSMSILKEPLLEEPVPQGGTVAGRAHHDTEISQREIQQCSFGMQIQDGRHLPTPSQNQQSRAVQDAAGVTVSCSLSDWISRPRGTLVMPKQVTSLSNAAYANLSDKAMSKHPGMGNRKEPSSSAPNQHSHESNMNKASDHRGAVSAQQKFKSTSDSCLQPRSLQVSDSGFESPDASPENTSLLPTLGRSTISRSCEVDPQSLFEIEELHDKELEEAQEHRRRCEVEERNALKAYRRAQRALVEANAHCNFLYRRRELYSAQLRSLLMEDPSLLWSTRERTQIGEAWNSSNNIPEVNLDLIPTSSHQLQAEFGAADQLGYDSNVQSADGDVHNRFSGNEDGQNLGSEACSELDASTSELLLRNSCAANGFRSHSNDPNLSPDEDDETSLNHRSVQDGTHLKEDTVKNSEKDMDVDSSTNFSADGSRDPLLLEAILRSKLVKRLGVIDSSKRGRIGDNNESAAEGVSEEDVTGAQPQMIGDGVALSDPKLSSADCREGPEKPEGSTSKPPVNIQNQQLIEEPSLNISPVPSFDPKEARFDSVDIASPSIISSSSIFRNAMKAACSVSSDSKQLLEQHHSSPDTCNDDNLLCSQDKRSFKKVSFTEEVFKVASFGGIDSYTCHSVVNPVWHLCMYELRGRCNNDQCPWQHVQNYSSRNDNQHSSSRIYDCQTGSSSNCQEKRGSTEISRVLTPPRYLVCLDSLKAESETYSSSQARHFGSSGKTIFSNSLAISSSLLKHLPADEPFLHGNDGCAEPYYGSRHSLYFQCRNGIGNALQSGVADNDTSLEMALLILNQEVNRLEGVKKALSVLSRALEGDPASLQLWIVYLLLYYSTKNSAQKLSKKSSVGEDDLFSCAVKHNERSYELWLLYINSRRRLDDRFAAYERALASLCGLASADDGHAVHTSGAILDLFLQMLHCFCVSGNVAKAVQRIDGLVHTDRDPDESHSLLLSDILQCLTISDKCVFWVCCVYLVIYRKLPDAMVQQFEFEKELSAMEWPSAYLTLREKQQVSKLLKMAIDSVALQKDCKSPESSALKSAHLLAVNHVKLLAAIHDEENCKMFLQKYRNSYSSCLELTLLSARSHSFEGFEEVLGNWPKEVPGVQCIWNQYAEYALEIDRADKAKEIMNQWFHSVWKPQFFPNQMMDAGNGDTKSSSVDTLSGTNLNAMLSRIDKMDLVFGLLNFSLYRLFLNDVLEAYLAIDKALKVADPELLQHCVRDHAVFNMNNRSKLKKDVSNHGLVDILKGYMIHARAFPARNPLTRKFIQDIKKPRLKQLVSNILSPIWADDSFLVNSVLDIWFGSSLVPQKSDDELKDLVDFVEAILEFSPANYQLVISACRLLCNSKSASVLLWVSSVLVHTIYHAIPVPPEYVWLEAADLLGQLTDVEEISVRFHQRALCVYPFSFRLWKSFLNLSTVPSKRSSVIEAAREKGIELE